VETGIQRAVEKGARVTAQFEPYRERISTTLLRTIGIAVAVSGLIAWSRGGLAQWPRLGLMVLWVSFGGHWVELLFLNLFRPKIGNSRLLRVALWFAGGILMAAGMGLSGFRPAWWVGGLGFIGVELIVHLLLHVGGRPSFYDGRG
jgi:hypothetical protein